MNARLLVTRDWGLELSRQSILSRHGRVKGKTLYEEFFHDLLSDAGKEQVLGDILHWINERLPVGGHRAQ